MDLPTVAFDESGNTGPDLLNEVQPVFSLASVCMDEDTARSLLSTVGADAAEAKFSELSQDESGQNKLLELLRSDALTPDTARVSVFHKPYTTVAKMVDILMEPGFYKRGWAEEFARDGSTLKWPTTLYELGPTQLGEHLWNALLAAFVAAVRKPSSERTAEVERLIGEARQHAPDARLQFPLQVFAEEVTEALGGKADVDPLDPAVPGLVEQMDYWGQAIGPFDVRHDQAESLERYREYFERLCDPAMEPFEIEGPDRTARFPLQAQTIDFVDSKAGPQVQVADLLAGACSFQQGAFERTSRDAQFAEAVAKTGIRRVFSQFVAPPEFLRRSMAGVPDSE